jgi:hypothetical protein
MQNCTADKPNKKSKYFEINKRPQWVADGMPSAVPYQLIVTEMERTAHRQDMSQMSGTA